MLDNISLGVKPGKTLALIGPSGCGKSTLLRIVMGLISPDLGKVQVGETEMNSETKLKLRHNMGYLIQKGGLFPHLTAKENCSLAAKYLGWSEPKITARITELAELTKITLSQMDKLPSKLSGGQQQRIGLIRALMLDPEVILLDEPLGSIDPLVRHDLQTDLKRIFDTLKKTVLLVTHDLSEAAYLGDQIALMKDGEIEQLGDIHSFIQEPRSEFVTQFVTAHRSLIGEAGT